MFSKCLSLIHHNDSYAFETGTGFYTLNVKGVNYKFKTESQYGSDIRFQTSVLSGCFYWNNNIQSAELLFIVFLLMIPGAPILKSNG